MEVFATDKLDSVMIFDNGKERWAVQPNYAGKIPHAQEVGDSPEVKQWLDGLAKDGLITNYERTLESMSKAELIEKAAELGLKWSNKDKRATNAKMIELIQAAS